MQICCNHSHAHRRTAMSGVRRKTCCGICKALSIYLRSTCRRPRGAIAILRAVNTADFCS